jgi:single-strand DNA-binding protein
MQGCLFFLIFYLLYIQLFSEKFGKKIYLSMLNLCQESLKFAGLCLYLGRNLNVLKFFNMSINKIILIGNVGKDPEVRYFDNGGAVANFTLATTERGYTAANGTQVPERTEWHNIVLWRGLAEIAEKYIRKGTKVYIEGKVRTRNYDDAQGIKRYITEVWGDQLELLGSRPDQANAGAPFPAPPGVTPSQTQTQAGTAPKPQTTENPPLETEEKDDLPF